MAKKRHFHSVFRAQGLLRGVLVAAFIALLLLWVDGRAANSQPMAGGQPPFQIDVRQMHGIPRPEPKLPAGSVTVRVIRGSLAKPAPDMEVKLVSLASSADAAPPKALRAGKTDAAGRVRFDDLDLATGELLATVEIDGQVLTSQPFDLPPQVGIALLLTTPPSPEDLPKGAADPGQMMGAAPSADQAPDPRMVHGIASPRDDVPMGGLRVRVVKDSWSAPVSGQLVDLVGIDEFGAISRSSARTNDQGEALFSNLASNAAYTALVSIDGRELFSQQMFLGGGPIGSAVVLSRYSDSDPTVPNERAPLDSMRATDAVGKGELLIAAIKTDGELRDQATAELYVFAGDSLSHNANPIPAVVESGRMIWRSLSVSGDAVYVAVVTHNKERYFSRPFRTIPNTGSAFAMVVDRPILLGFQFGAMLHDGMLVWSGSMVVGNFTGRPINFGKVGRTFSLPKNTSSATVEGDWKDRMEFKQGEGLIWRGFLPPGESTVTLFFSQSTGATGSVDFDWSSPYGFEHWLLAVEDRPGLTIEMPTNAKREDVERRDVEEDDSDPEAKNNVVIRLIGESIKPGESVRLSLSGYPAQPSWMRRNRDFAVAVGVVFILGGLCIALFAQFGFGPQHVRKRSLLEREIAAMMAELEELERARLANQADEKSQRRRAALLSQAAEKMKTLDKLVDEASAG